MASASAHFNGCRIPNLLAVGKSPGLRRVSLYRHNDDQGDSRDMNGRNAMYAKEFRKQRNPKTGRMVAQCMRAANSAEEIERAQSEDAEVQARGHRLSELTAALHARVGDLASHDDCLGDSLPFIAERDALD